ncbi:hypothetical protein F4561_006184 [Lipingzhangella halophila]|uniref:Uncharacterized protein n=1 Tax=Lipingzhangella halophila TaxID=1783352 RepID=A0A7W7RNL6_9ACTN|nr:hypothetical protein [Lipingzhangella halophila]MBB4935290.1 hypothetical protein [Lipingzhangella halophila]
MTATLTRWGRSPRHADAHSAAARLQARNPGLIVWFGETSGTYHVLDDDGLHEHASLDAATMFAWWRTNRPQPRTYAPRGSRGAQR